MIFSDLKFIFVISGGEMSNFLFDDYEAILKFMNAEKQKKTLKM